MDKKDIKYMVGALCIILIIVLVIKPVLTGKQANTGINLNTPIPTVTPVTMVKTNVTQQIITIMKTIPTPVPTWDKNVTTMNLVDPSSYGISMNQSFSNNSSFNEKLPDTNKTTYANFSGQYSGTTQTINIPFPYWELVYTVSPFPTVVPAKTQIIPTKGEGISYSGVQGSYSTENPEFSIQVMDASDPNRIVRVITPPGGIDLDSWTGVMKTVTINPNKPSSRADYKTTDPRPWTEKFFEGQRSYFFIINAHNLKSYNIEIQVPTRYVGKY